MTRKILVLSLIAPLGLAACGPEPEPDPDPVDDTLTVRATASNDTFSAELLSLRPLSTGRNVVHYRLTEKASGDAVTDATVTHLPMMDMGEHSHSCPFVEPSLVGDDWAGEIVFTMGSGEMGKWSITLTVAQGEGEPQELVFENVSVTETNARRDLVAGEQGYIVTLNFDGAPKVGLNEFVLTVHARGGMMGGGFAPQTDLAITVTPEMPSMGHGSSGNVNPVHDANGSYRGKVNFSMAGKWTVDFAVTKGGEELGVVQFPIEL